MIKMIEKIVSKYLNVELFEFIQGKNEIEITLHDYLDKGIKFENDVESIVNELRKIYYKVEWEVYNPQDNREDEGYELAFIKIIE